MVAMKTKTGISGSRLGVLALLCLITGAHALGQGHYVQTVDPAPTTTTITVPGDSAFAGTGVATSVGVVSSTGAVVSSGTVTISDGTTVLGSIPVVNGTATFTPALQSVGANQLTACFVAEQNFDASCSTPLSVGVAAPFTLEEASTTGVTTLSKPFINQITVVPAQGFAGTVSLSCDGDGGSCTLSPTTMTFSGTGTPQTGNASFLGAAPTAAAIFILAPLFGFFGRRRRRVKQLMVIGSSCVLLLGLAGCHALSFAIQQSGTMVVTAQSGGYSQSVTCQVTVN
jgi:hypothetical protein